MFVCFFFITMGSFDVIKAILFVLSTASLTLPALSQETNLNSSLPELPTVTVRGFLNFRTTVDGTVIVFTHSSDIHPHTVEPKIAKTSFTDNIPLLSLPSNNFLHNDEINFGEGVDDGLKNAVSKSSQNAENNIKTVSPKINLIENKIQDPYLQQITDNAVLPTLGKISNDFDKIKKISSPDERYTTGLVTILGATNVEGSSTTIFETKVMGTFIDGKYAQVLQSTSYVVRPSSNFIDSKALFKHSTITRISENSMTEPTKIMAVDNLSESSGNAELVSSSLKTPTISSKIISSPSVSYAFVSKVQSVPKESQSVSEDLEFSERKKPTESLTFVGNKPNFVVLESSFSSQLPTITIETDLPTQSLENAMKSSSFRFEPISFSTLTLSTENDVTDSAITKNQRQSSSPRNRYLTPRRPTQSVRLNRFKVKLTVRNDSHDDYGITEDSIIEDDLDESTTEDDMEIAFGTDPKVVFHETTITSEVTLHVGRRKSVRTLTITTSVPLTVHPTDIQNILSTEPATETDSDHRIVTRTFTTTERALKTSIVPVFDGKTTTYHKVTESFFIMKIITAYRTLPSGEASVIESIIDDSDANPVTLEIAANIHTSVTQTNVPILMTQEIPRMNAKHPSLPIQFMNPLGNPLAAVYLGLQQLNAQMTLYSTKTDTSTYVTTDTVYNTKTVRFYDGRKNRFRTVTESKSTIKRTLTTTVTSLQPYLNTQALHQQQQLQKLIAPTQLSPFEHQYNTITSTITTATTTTSLSTRIYTLIYNGFSTKYRTVISTSTYPTTVTITSTARVPVSGTKLNAPFGFPYSN